MNMVIFVMALGVVFLGGVLLIAILIESKYADRSAVYKLYAVRDQLISLVVFDEISRDDPWIDGLYDTVNSMLMGARYFSGPERWGLASATGKVVGEQFDSRPSPKLPDYEPNDKVKAVLRNLRPALHIAGSNHIGLIIYWSAESRARLKRQRDEAKRLQNQIKRFELC